MIKTQLCPVGELEDKNWWYFDAVALILVAALSYLGVEKYLDSMREDVERLRDKKIHWDKELAAKQPGIEKFNGLKSEMELLNKKVGALQKITTSKIDKVKPLVAMDQLQTLWIDGIWYESLDYGSDGLVTIKGAAHDSILIGEYMLGLRETMNPDTRNDDLRTRLGFDGMALKSVHLSEGSDEIFKDITKKLQFEVSARHVEKMVAPSAAASVTLGPRPRSPRATQF